MDEVLFIAPGGNDSNPGTKEKPFATLERARDAIREKKAGAGPAGPTAVFLRDGSYALKEPFVLTPEDSGSKEEPISYQSYDGETATISGGRNIPGPWETFKDKILVANVADVMEEIGVFRVLSVGGKRMKRSRLPETGFFHIDEVIGDAAFSYKSGDIPDLQNSGDAEIVMIHSWNETRFRVESLETSSRQVICKDPNAKHPIGWSGSHGQNRYYVENTIEGLTAPGQWCLDSKSGKLYLWPEGSDDAPVVTVPVTEQLVRCEGSLDGDEFLEYLTFSNLVFTDTGWSLPEAGYPDCGDVGDIVDPSTFTLKAARNCTISGNTIKNTGTYALEINGYGNCIEDNRIYDTGSGGIISRNFHEPHNVIRYNHVHHCGLVYTSAVGINIDEGGGTVSHNLIHDITHSGVYARHWATATQPQERRNQEQGLTIEFNEIFNIMTVINDGGGIFVRDSNIVLRNNLIHDSYAGDERCPGWGIYLGCETRDTLVESNIIYNTLESLHVWYYDRNIDIVNNILISSKASQIRYNNPEHLSHENIRFLRNIVVSTVEAGNLFRISDEGSIPTESDYNLYHSTVDKDADSMPITGLAGTETYKIWREKGKDANSIFADPTFVDMKNEDFSLKPGSPAGKIGFKPIDISNVGLRGRKSKS